MNQALISPKIRSNFDAEVAVLGSVLTDRKSFAAASEKILSVTYFYWEKHRMVWDAIQKLILDDEPIDIITVSENLKLEIGLGKISASFICDLIDHVPTSNNCGYYAELVAEEYRAREIIRSYTNGISELQEAALSRDIWEKTSNNTSGLFREQKEYYTIDILEQELSEPKPAWGKHWGVEALDCEIGQFPAGAIIVIGGRPGHMKTTLAIQLMDSWALMGESVFFQSMEMTSREIDLRRLSRFSEIPLWKIKQGGHNIKSAVDEIKIREKHFIVSDSAGLTPDEVVLNIRIAHEKHGITFFVLDHFHRLVFSKTKGEHRHLMEEGFEKIVSACKNKKITPVILAQLNRGIENSEGDREPKLSDLRECGRLEEAATNVLLMWWNFKKTQNERDKGEIKIFNAKSRDGKTGRFYTQLNPEIYKFGNLLPRRD